MLYTKTYSKLEGLTVYRKGDNCHGKITQLDTSKPDAMFVIAWRDGLFGQVSHDLFNGAINDVRASIVANARVKPTEAELDSLTMSRLGNIRIGNDGVSIIDPNETLNAARDALANMNTLMAGGELTQADKDKIFTRLMNEPKPDLSHLSAKDVQSIHERLKTPTARAAPAPRATATTYQSDMQIDMDKHIKRAAKAR
jgi:hypothetical protein